MQLEAPRVVNQLTCFHCGEKYFSGNIRFENKDFCCDGCKLVYELLNENNLCTYYSLNSSPGITVRSLKDRSKYEYLDNPVVTDKLIHFKEGDQAHVSFYVPKMHCSSCVWLLENLHRLDKGVVASFVNFPKKEIRVIYNQNELKLSAIVALLAHVGYEPLISLDDVQAPKRQKKDRSGIIRIGIAGFCFGNIMMLSFPEYFSFGNFYEQGGLKTYFGYLNLILSLPVLLYSASGFFVSSWKSIKQKFLNIDLPIAFAIVITFTRSVYEILTGTGAGYLDSMTGIVFFMLLGRYFQDLTYDTLSFERDYRSYFPVSVGRIKDEMETAVPVSELQSGDTIMVRNEELIPADAVLLSDQTYIDYSFVTGESRPVKKVVGDLIYAGGRQMHGAAKLEVVKRVSESYLTELWNKHNSLKETKDESSFVTTISKYFTVILFSIAAVAFAYWSLKGDTGRAIDAVTAVLIVACPCALLLSATFTNGNVLRILRRSKLYIKNNTVVERMTKVEHIVFDKTGTISHGSSVHFHGQLTDEKSMSIVSLAAQSAHPLSRKICEHYNRGKLSDVKEFVEIPGKGIKGYAGEDYIVLGSSLYVTGRAQDKENNFTNVFVSINGTVKGFFSISSSYRAGLKELADHLKQNYTIHLLSGDNESERENLKPIFGDRMYFGQSPQDKSAFIEQLKSTGAKVMMIGDGLNDSGALSQSDVGIVISDDINNFSPACDAILDGASFQKIPGFMKYAKGATAIIIGSFVISILYNIIGLTYATQGALSPVVAAILMPVSSVSIVLFTTIASSLLAKRIGL